MPKRSTVKQLPQTVKDWLDAALVENNFSDYSALHCRIGSLETREAADSLLSSPSLPNRQLRNFALRILQ